MKNQTQRNGPKLPPQPAQPCSELTKLADVGHLLSVPEAASRLGVKPATIRAWILRREKLEVVKIGRCVRITERSVNTFINNNLIPPTNKKETGRLRSLSRYFLSMKFCSTLSEKGNDGIWR